MGALYDRKLTEQEIRPGNWKCSMTTIVDDENMWHADGHHHKCAWLRVYEVMKYEM